MRAMASFCDVQIPAITCAMPGAWPLQICPVRNATHQREARLNAFMSSATLRRCSALLPLEMACSTQFATWSERISSSTARKAARTAEICVTMSIQ
jgi:hypothetical protein